MRARILVWVGLPTPHDDTGRGLATMGYQLKYLPGRMSKVEHRLKGLPERAVVKSDQKVRSAQNLMGGRNVRKEATAKWNAERGLGPMAEDSQAVE